MSGQTVFDGKSSITPQAMANTFSSPLSHVNRDEFETGSAELALLLLIAQQQFEQSRDPAVIIHRLVTDLHTLRAKMSDATWKLLVPLAQNHSVADYVHEDPFTRWSFEKPRGYSGDAHLLDFIYGHQNTQEEVANASELGRTLYGYTRQSPASVAVRERRDLLTRHVDEIALGHPGSEVLTIAAGHLREANASVALHMGHIKRWIALDQDPLSIGSITRDFHATPVEAIDGSVRGLLGNVYKLGQFDFVYAAGLYDYLARNTAIKLTKRCLQMLKPKGTFLFANFAKDIPDDGYMETFMNWQLILRTEADMWGVINASVDRNTVDASVHFGANGNIVYGVIRKRD